MKRVKFMNISISELSMSGIFTEKPRKNGKKELSDKFRVLLEKRHSVETNHSHLL